MSHHHHQKVLFILKKRRIYNLPYEQLFSSGLFNSAMFVSQMLNRNGIESKVVDVVDNNDIDREVTLYKPTTVIIEALWVVPEKFDVLHALHPKVDWVVRLHSEIPFIANEGMAMDWLFRYNKPTNNYKVTIGVNSYKMMDDLDKIGVQNLVYMPNYYDVIYGNSADLDDLKKNYLDIGCFGAIRPMKNQLIQAVAAIGFGDRINRDIHFHINSGRVEKGDSVLQNLRALFANQSRHKLVEHEWMNHDDFIQLVRTMDYGLQVSFNETFNIVAADFATLDIPIIGSGEIEWLNVFYKANTTDSNDIIDKLRFAQKGKFINLQRLNKRNLIEYCNKSERIWVHYFKCD